jgi:hypothetical protein
VCIDRYRISDGDILVQREEMERRKGPSFSDNFEIQQ